MNDLKVWMIVHSLIHNLITNNLLGVPNLIFNEYNEMLIFSFSQSPVFIRYPTFI